VLPATGPEPGSSPGAADPVDTPLPRYASAPATTRCCHVIVTGAGPRAAREPLRNALGISPRGRLAESGPAPRLAVLCRRPGTGPQPSTASLPAGFWPGRAPQAGLRPPGPAQRGRRARARCPGTAAPSAARAGEAVTRGGSSGSGGHEMEHVRRGAWPGVIRAWPCKFRGDGPRRPLSPPGPRDHDEQAAPVGRRRRLRPCPPRSDEANPAAPGRLPTPTAAGGDRAGATPPARAAPWLYTRWGFPPAPAIVSGYCFAGNARWPRRATGADVGCRCPTACPTFSSPTPPRLSRRPASLGLRPADRRAPPPGPAGRPGRVRAGPVHALTQRLLPSWCPRGRVRAYDVRPSSTPSPDRTRYLELRPVRGGIITRWPVLHGPGRSG